MNTELSPYAKWEGAVIRQIEEELDVCTSDAQGIMEAQPLILDQCWKMGSSAAHTAKRILNAS